MRQTPFFARKVLLITITSTFALYILGGFAAHQGGEYLEQRRKEQAIAREKHAFEKLSDEEKAIKKTHAYMPGAITLAGPTERVFFSYLQRKFNLDPLLGSEGPPIPVKRGLGVSPEPINYLVRIAYPDEIVRQKPQHSELESNVAITNIYSANCDHMDLPANFWAVMQESVRLGDYFVSHVALALEMMENNGCAMPPVATDLDNETAQQMVKIIEDPNTVADLRYEAIAFLLMRDHRDLVEQEWIDQITSEQLQDGTWPHKAGDTNTDFHSTLLAFWSLLEYSRPDTPDEPLILRPTKTP